MIHFLTHLITNGRTSFVSALYTIFLKGSYAGRYFNACYTSVTQREGRDLGAVE